MLRKKTIRFTTSTSITAAFTEIPSPFSSTSVSTITEAPKTNTASITVSLYTTTEAKITYLATIASKTPTTSIAVRTTSFPTKTMALTTRPKQHPLPPQLPLKP